jgi:hypothetical protein
MQITRLLHEWLSTPDPLSNAIRSLASRGTSISNEGIEGMEQEIADQVAEPPRQPASI